MADAERKMNRRGGGKETKFRSNWRNREVWNISETDSNASDTDCGILPALHIWAGYLWTIDHVMSPMARGHTAWEARGNPSDKRALFH
eukprot:3493053-Prymnesium_polylepis.1